VDQRQIVTIVIAAAAYLAGSIPFGLLFARARGVDIQKVGSGNIGATNVARVLGKPLGATVLLLDAAKGALPVSVGMWLAQEGLAGSVTAATAGVAAVAGHCFPVWLRFHGGKGVATALGVVAVLDPIAAVVGIVLFAGSYALFRLSSLGSLVATVAFPLILWIRHKPPWDVAIAILMVAIIVFRHRENLKRLLAGKEHKV